MALKAQMCLLGRMAVVILRENERKFCFAYFQRIYFSFLKRKFAEEDAFGKNADLNLN